MIVSSNINIEGAGNRVAESQTRKNPPPAPSATILRLCRCGDCRRWDHQYGHCPELGLRAYVPRENVHPAMRQFWTDLATIRLDEWHYCKFYDGPAVSKDVWVWPRLLHANDHV